MYRMAEKSVYQSKIEYLPYDTRKRTDFFTSDKGVFELCIFKGMPRETFWKVYETYSYLNFSFFFCNNKMKTD